MSGAKVAVSFPPVDAWRALYDPSFRTWNLPTPAPTHHDCMPCEIDNHVCRVCKRRHRAREGNCQSPGCGHAWSQHNESRYCQSPTTADGAGPCVCGMSWSVPKPSPVEVLIYATGERTSLDPIVSFNRHAGWTPTGLRVTTSHIGKTGGSFWLQFNSVVGVATITGSHHGCDDCAGADPTCDGDRSWLAGHECGFRWLVGSVRSITPIPWRRLMPNYPEHDGPCPMCGDCYGNRTPIHPWTGTCWACVPCMCGQQCGYGAGLAGANGVPACEQDMWDPERDALLASRLLPPVWSVPDELAEQATT